MPDEMASIISVVREHYLEKAAKFNDGAKEFLLLCEKDFLNDNSSKTELYESIRKELKMWLLGTRRTLSFKEKQLIKSILDRISEVIK